MRYGKTLGIIGWFLVGTGCVAAFACKRHGGTTTEPHASLKQLVAEDTSLYLSYGSSEGSYEFVTCDATVPMEGALCGESCGVNKRPQHCVSAFRSVERASYCNIYYVLKPRCANLEEFKAYCANLSNAGGKQMPEGFSSLFECDPGLIETIDKGCSIAVPGMAETCQSSFEQKQACAASGPDSQVCQSFEAVSKKRIPFELSSAKLQISRDQKAALQQQIRYEKLLIAMNNQTSWRVQAFGEGSFIAATFSKRSWNMIMRMVPEGTKRQIFSRAIMGKQRTLGTQHLIAAAGTGGVLSGVRAMGSDNLNDQTSFLPSLYCKTMMSQGIPVPTVLDDRDKFRQSLVDWAPAGLAGAGTNMLVLKATNKAHPVIKYGLFLVVPFMTFLVSENLKDSSPNVVEKEFSRLMEPKPLTAETESGLKKVPAQMGEILSVLGRSMIFTRKATTQSVSEYCLPKKTVSGYEADCYPVFSGDEGSLYEAKFGGAHGIGKDVCAGYLGEGG